MNNAENKLSDIVEVMLNYTTPVTKSYIAKDIVTLVTDYHYHRWGEYTWYASTFATLLVSDYNYDRANLATIYKQTAKSFHKPYVIYHISFVEDKYIIKMIAEVKLHE